MRPWAPILLLALAGCIAPSYDSIEQYELAEVKVMAANLKPLCPALAVADIHTHLAIPAALALEQTRYRPNATEIVKADQLLADMIGEMERDYGGATRPSVAFCQAKLVNIADAADRIMRATSVLSTK